MGVTGRLVPHTGSRRRATTAQAKLRGVITAHWKSLVKGGSVVATLWIPDIAGLALRRLCDQCYLHVHCRCDLTCCARVALIRRPTCCAHVALVCRRHSTRPTCAPEARPSFSVAAPHDLRLVVCQA